MKSEQQDKLSDGQDDHDIKLGDYNITESVISLRTGFNDNSNLSNLLSHSFSWEAPYVSPSYCYAGSPSSSGHKYNSYLVKK